MKIIKTQLHNIGKSADHGHVLGNGAQNKKSLKNKSSSKKSIYYEYQCQNMI